MADENVPQGISDKQDEIIQYVAKYVVSSCDGARYQEKIRTRTKYNSYFAFLDAKHPYHHYYQYLLDSYRYYLLNSEAVNAGGWGGGGDGSGAAGQQQLTEEEYYQFYGAYQAQTGGIGFQTGEGEESANENASHPHGGGGAASAAVSAATAGAGADNNMAVVSGSNAQETAEVQAAGEELHDEEEEEDAYELVMENGEWVSRKRS